MRIRPASEGPRARAWVPGRRPGAARVRGNWLPLVSTNTQSRLTTSPLGPKGFVWRAQRTNSSFLMRKLTITLQFVAISGTFFQTFHPLNPPFYTNPSRKRRTTCARMGARPEASRRACTWQLAPTGLNQHSITIDDKSIGPKGICLESSEDKFLFFDA